tara:strand:+ start:1405 stop:2061 length:657 start_codon:yes stop_codon:yes gene_type:complete
MPLESTTTIEGLDDSYPLGGDPTNKGDDHLRLIKSVLKTMFPGAGGNGFSIPVVATEVEFNYISGLTSNAQDQFDALGVSITALTGQLSAPTGTRMPFHQAAAPTGWTQDASKNDYMLRVVSGTGGAAGGTDSPILNDKVSSHTHTASVTDPGHTHVQDFTNEAGVDFDSFGAGGRYRNNAGFVTTSSTTGISVSVAANAGSSDWTPKYLDIIIAVKD